ncbi:hypothetical protein M405DRAFT_747710, partial [Rhizopogon salebrosus TDB-379]
KPPAELGRSSSTIFDKSENHQTVITKASWIEAGRKSTTDFKMHGSPVPLVWVLVEDNIIPPNAIPFGEDKHGPLYIARALLEFALDLGKAGGHLPHALITYGGREHQIKTYEVLVCASQLRWGLTSSEPAGSLSPGTLILAQQNRQLLHFIGTALSVNDIPRFMPDLAVVPSADGGLKKHTVPDYKTVVLIDDSASVGEQSWDLVREALTGITDLANQYGSQGIDVHFLHHHNSHTNIKTSHGIQRIFDQTYPEGQDTPTAAKLEELISRYLPLVERKHTQHKPIHIIVITDGVASDNHAFPEVIFSAAHRLERSQVPHEMFGIQFVQVGTDPDAAATLRSLGGYLAKESRIRDIVDVIPYDPQQGAFDTQYMLKIFLGDINKALDNGSPAPRDERQGRERRVEVHQGLKTPRGVSRVREGVA